MGKRLVFLLSVILLSASAYAGENCWSADGCLRITGIGHGVVSSDDSQPLPQRQLLAIRAAKVDALRSLAEQAKGVHLSTRSHLEGVKLRSDVTTTRLETLLQGIRYVSVEPVEEGLYRAIVEIDIYR